MSKYKVEVGGFVSQYRCRKYTIYAKPRRRQKKKPRNGLLTICKGTVRVCAERAQ